VSRTLTTYTTPLIPLPPTFVQDPQAVLDYTLDWGYWMVAGDYIVSASFVPSADLVVISQNWADSIATGWILAAGAQIGRTYAITCHITTDGGRQDDRTFSITINQE
jgi:hypothetical protein